MNKLGTMNIWCDIDNNHLYKISSVSAGYSLSGYNATDFVRYPLLKSTEQAISAQLNNNILKKLNYTLSPDCTNSSNHEINISADNIIYWQLKKIDNTEQI
jgi:hypothetical protein